MFDLIYLGLKKIVFSAHKSYARAFLHMFAMYSNSRQKIIRNRGKMTKKLLKRTTLAICDGW